MNIPLSVVDIGEEYIIKKISGKQEVRQHLENMGFVIGGAVRVVSENNGNLIVAVKESRVAVSKEMATRIYV
ncbi:MAG: ferrous iron transport protein A [Treponemataceae bacterium]|jgi:ferrous iron transport protein A|nr:ferrous iron transport protein A [Treponemataceae bacterium]